MLTLEEINNKFVSIIPMLENIVKGIAYKNNKQIETHAAINEAYIYVIENSDIMKSEDFLQRVTIQYLNKAITWNTSKLNKLESVNNINTDFLIEEVDNSEEDLQYKIDLENWYNDRLCTLELYRSQEESKIKRIIFDVYFKKGITKGVDLAKHLNINKDYACRYIRELKQDIRDFKQTLNNK